MKKLFGLALVLSINLVYAASFDGMLSGSDSVLSITQQKHGSCIFYNDITVVTNIESDTPGEEILVKSEPDANCNFVAETGWLIDSGIASYYKGRWQNWLIIDRGTGTDNRDILLYDLVTHQQAYSDTYSDPIKISDNKLMYWKSSGTIATMENCDIYEKAQQLGLSLQLQQYVAIDLATTNLQVKSLNKTRCQMTQ